MWYVAFVKVVSRVVLRATLFEDGLSLEPALRHTGFLRRERIGGLVEFSSSWNRREPWLFSPDVQCPLIVQWRISRYQELVSQTRSRAVLAREHAPSSISLWRRIFVQRLRIYASPDAIHRRSHE